MVDLVETARTRDEMLSDAELCEAWGHNARNRSAERFLVFEQVRQWIQCMHELVDMKAAKRAAPIPRVDRGTKADALSIATLPGRSVYAFGYAPACNMSVS